MYKYIFIAFFVFFSSDLIAQQKKIPEGYTLITLDGEDAYMNFDTGDVIRTVPLKSSQKYINNTGQYEETSSIHIVKKGETLYRISRKYGLSVAEIMRINELTNSSISIGQKLKITSSTLQKKSLNELSTDYYIVKSGDTLYSIAKNNNIDVSELKALNNLSSNAIKIGQRLRLK